MFVYLKAYVKGFKHCKPLIGINGYHLNVKCGGQLLVVVGIDINDYIFPIACAVVETESIKLGNGSSTN